MCEQFIILLFIIVLFPIRTAVNLFLPHPVYGQHIGNYLTPSKNDLPRKKNATVNNAYSGTFAAFQCIYNPDFQVIFYGFNKDILHLNTYLPFEALKNFFN